MVDFAQNSAPNRTDAEGELPTGNSSAVPSEEPEIQSDDDSIRKSLLNWGDRDRFILLVYCSFFFVLLVGQYAWFVFDKPQPLPWKRGEQFQTFRVDVNNATWVDWMQLPGIGQTMAERILADLDRNGPFASIDDLTRVRGIGPRTLERIRPWLTINEK